MQANSFYGKKHSATGILSNNPDNANLTVFNSGGAGATKVLNTTPVQGFKYASGKASNFYGADGDTSVPASMPTAAAAPSVTTTTTSTVANPQATLGLNVPTLLVLAAGLAIGFFVGKENMI